MAAPVITIFVRHSADCKYKADEFSRRCACKKHFRWTRDGKQYRKQAGTRAWAEAEELKRHLQDQLAGRDRDTAPVKAKSIEDAIDLFLTDKKVQGLTPDLLKKYRLWLARFQTYCEKQGVFTVQAINREIITGFCSTWADVYPSSLTRSKLRERYKGFMRYCHQAEWLDRVPAWPLIRAETPPTLPLTADEYNRLLAAVETVIRRRDREYWIVRVRALFQLMRWSGLAIMDALTLRRDELIQDSQGHFSIVTSREKTGTDVSVPIPSAVGEELLAVPNDNPVFFFWSGEGSKKSITGNWGKRFIVPAFDAAGIKNGGNMRSHRLRDTFAVDLLEKGVPLEEVSKLLGHTSIKTTEKSYSAWVRGRQDRLNALVRATWN